MSFKDVTINRKYKSVGKETIPTIVNELLKCTKYYKRSVGFFSASALDFISTGIHNLIKNNGTIQIVTSPKLSADDIEAIKLGYENKNEYIFNKFNDEFRNALQDLGDDNLRYLAQLISFNILDIRIVNKKDFGMYHDKVAIFEDNDENKVVFVGSNNETAYGYGINYETARVYKSWEHKDDVIDEEKTFDEIWNGEDEFLETLEFDDARKKNIIEIIEQARTGKKTKKEKYELYPYQVEAINAWIDNCYKGFFVMATGTGKTITSIYAMKKLISDNKIFTVIAVPYKHLVSQWYDDVNDILGDKCSIHKVSSEFPKWDNEIKDALYANKYGEHKNIIVITTIASFYSERFDNVIKTCNEEKLLVVDEAHNFLNKIYERKHFIDYDYKLGLSATPVFGNDSTKTKNLCDFFGGIVYELPIEKAIGKFLVNYKYTPVFVNATKEDEKTFEMYRKKMLSLIDRDTGKIKDSEAYTKAYRGKLRAISMADEKMIYLDSLIDSIGDPDHFIIYCSDGKIGDVRHLNEVVNRLNRKGFKPSQFTCEEDMERRVSLIDNFNKGYIHTLVAIRCLDEGINIPSINTALILSSNDNYREFVQRRGRILRKYLGKTEAHIIDVIVLPSMDCKGIAEIEFRRFYEYAKLATNKDSLFKTLDMYMNTYDLSMKDISFKNDYVEEAILDE